jgi:hypothetical protein
MSIKPEDILPDDTNIAIIEGIRVRKGTVAAALANLKILDSPTASQKDKDAAIQIIRELAPALVVLGFKKYLTFNDSAIQQIVDEAARQLKH